jgi:hypothetical protein
VAHAQLRQACGWLLLAAGAVSCGGGSTGGGSLDAAPEGAAVVVVPATEFINEVCDLVAPCCERARRGDGGKRCRAGLEGVLVQGIYDAAAAGLCIAQLRSSKPEAVCELSMSSTSPCQMAVAPNQHPGNKQPGEGCSSSAECAASPEGEVECRGRPGPGWCELQVRGKEGDAPCVATVLDRGRLGRAEAPGTRPTRAFLCYQADDLHCDAGTKPRCAKPRPTGSPCTAEGDCARTDYCRSGELRCRRLIPVGAACNTELACVDEATCTLSTHTCTVWRPAGAVCSAGEQCHSGVCEGSICGPRLDALDWPLFLNRYCASPDGGVASDAALAH